MQNSNINFGGNHPPYMPAIDFYSNLVVAVWNVHSEIKPPWDLGQVFYIPTHFLFSFFSCFPVQMTKYYFDYLK